MKAFFDNQAPSRMSAAAVVATTATAWHIGSPAQSAAVPVETQGPAERGVRVTPRPLTAGATVWDFAVVLDTHSASLDVDLGNSAVLLVDGRAIRPTRWAEADGHHREGVLTFPAPSQAPGSVELRIQRANEDVARVFRWDGTALC